MGTYKFIEGGTVDLEAFFAAGRRVGHLFAGCCPVMGIVAGDDDTLLGALLRELDLADRTVTLLCALLAGEAVSGGIRATIAVVHALEGVLEHGLLVGLVGAPQSGEVLVGESAVVDEWAGRGAEVVDGAKGGGRGRLVGCIRGRRGDGRSDGMGHRWDRLHG